MRRIAESIGIGIDAFGPNASTLDTELAQSASLMKSFLSIHDPELRKKCLAFVLQIAAESVNESSCGAPADLTKI